MIEGKFITTLPSVVGYDIEKSQGILLDNSVISANKALKGLVKKAEELGCNALVNVRIDSSAIKTESSLTENLFISYLLNSWYSDPRAKTDGRPPLSAAAARHFAGHDR